MTRKARIVAALVAATLTFTSSPALWAQDASHKFTAMDEFQLQRPTDPQISPDGKKIAYVRRFADPMTDKRYSNLWIINTDGTDHRPPISEAEPFYEALKLLNADTVLVRVPEEPHTISRRPSHHIAKMMYIAWLVRTAQIEDVASRRPFRLRLCSSLYRWEYPISSKG